jgi:hypothetical protein
MKKIFTSIALAFLFFSCDDLITDLPKTDTNKYINGNTVIFPKGTKSIDIYNTIVSIFPDNEYHEVTGEWKYIKTDTDNDGLITQTWQSVSFIRINHTHTIKSPEINTHTVRLYSSETSIKEIVFEWQRQTTNIWKNESIGGDITFTF